MKYILILFLLIAGLLVSPTLPLAGTNPDLSTIEYQKINPGDDFKFVLKRLREKISLGVLSFFPSKKVDYYQDLIGVRLAELKYIVDRKDVANIQTTSQRYSATAGQLAGFVIGKNLKDRKKPTADLLVLHIPILEKLRDSYEESDKSEWRFIQDDINSLKSYISKLSE